MGINTQVGNATKDKMSVDQDTNKSSATHTIASNSHGMLALMLSHSVVLTKMLQSMKHPFEMSRTELQYDVTVIGD